MGLAYFYLLHDALGRLRCSFFFESFRYHIEEATTKKGEGRKSLITTRLFFFFTC